MVSQSAVRVKVVPAVIAGTVVLDRTGLGRCCGKKKQNNEQGSHPDRGGKKQAVGKEHMALQSSNRRPYVERSKSADSSGNRRSVRLMLCAHGPP